MERKTRGAEVYPADRFRERDKDVEGDDGVHEAVRPRVVGNLLASML